MPKLLNTKHKPSLFADREFKWKGETTMTKSETLNKLALIQKEIEQLELLQKEADSFYFEETKLNGKIDTTNFKSAMSYFNITLDPTQTKLFVDSILKMKNEEYATLFRKITVVV